MKVENVYLLSSLLLLAATSGVSNALADEGFSYPQGVYNGGPVERVPAANGGITNQAQLKAMSLTTANADPKIIEITDGVWTLLPSDFCPRLRVCHCPGEDHVHGSQEEVGPFEEERPPLRKEQGEPRVHVQLGYVGFNLGKVRVEGAIKDEVGRHAPPGGDSGFMIGLTVLP